MEGGDTEQLLLVNTKLHHGAGGEKAREDAARKHPRQRRPGHPLSPCAETTRVLTMLEASGLAGPG